MEEKDGNMEMVEHRGCRGIDRRGRSVCEIREANMDEVLDEAKDWDEETVKTVCLIKIAQFLEEIAYKK